MSYVESDKELHADIKAMMSLRRVIRLFKNKRKPRRGDKSSDYVEPDGGIYNAISLSEGDWKIDGNKASVSVSFFSEEPVYGMYMTGDGGRTFYGAELFGKNAVDGVNGINIEITVELERARIKGT